MELHVYDCRRANDCANHSRCCAKTWPLCFFEGSQPLSGADQTYPLDIRLSGGKRTYGGHGWDGRT